MTINDNITNEKTQFDANREAVKISAIHQVTLINISFSQLQKCYILVKKRVIEQTNFLFSPFPKAFKKQIKTIEDFRGKQMKEREEQRKQLVKSSSEKEPVTLLK